MKTYKFKLYQHKRNRHLKRQIAGITYNHCLPCTGGIIGCMVRPLMYMRYRVGASTLGVETVRPAQVG